MQKPDHKSADQSASIRPIKEGRNGKSHRPFVICQGMVESNFEAFPTWLTKPILSRCTAV
jgi:hypothetical protein